MIKKRIQCLTGVLAAAALIAACGPREPEPAPEPTPAPPPAVEPDPVQAPPEALAPPPAAAPQPQPGSGVPVWAEEHDGLIAGLDDRLYAPYHPATIERVQQALADRNLYTAPINGVLDQPTMEAIRSFQEDNGLGASGVPTPRTRALLFDEEPQE